MKRLCSLSFRLRLLSVSTARRLAPAASRLESVCAVGIPLMKQPSSYSSTVKGEVKRYTAIPPYTSHEAHNGAAKSVRERVSFSTEEQAHPGTLQFTQTAGQGGERESCFAINYMDLNCAESAVIGLEPCLVST